MADNREQNEFVDFEFEFYNKVPGIEHLEDELWQEARRRLTALTKGNTDLIGASVAIELPSEAETPYIYQARVIAYVRPKNIVAVEKADHAILALKGALSAVESQVYEQRERLRGY